jgi:MmyB-like transcription regulator ligand binding domain
MSASPGSAVTLASCCRRGHSGHQQAIWNAPRQRDTTTAHQQRPAGYPAIIIDRYGEIIAANAAQQILAENAARHVRSNAYRLALHPEGMAPRIGNFPEWRAT